jgi:hypothetical protein
MRVTAADRAFLSANRSYSGKRCKPYVAHLPVRRTLEKLGILPGSFYRWVDRYQTGGVEALEDKPSKPSRVVA